MSKIEHDVLAEAARVAIKAPSVFNTQPWRWRISGRTLELSADWDRQLSVTDPGGRLLLLSCGAALHHARVALAAAGWGVEVHRLIRDPAGRVVARVSLLEPREPTQDDLALHEAIFRRRTDRRPFGDDPVGEDSIRAMASAAAAEGVQVHRVRPNQMPMLAIATASAGAAEMSDPAYRAELIRWTNRPEWSRDGVPAETAVARVPRRVPAREYAIEPRGVMPVPPGGDRGAAYLVLYGEGQSPRDWLRAGEALSAVLLAAVARGLSVAPMSDVIEVERTRELVRGLLPGTGHPYVVVRTGTGTAPSELAEAPRRSPSDVIDGFQPW